MWNRAKLLLEKNDYNECSKWLDLIHSEFLKDSIEKEVKEKLQRYIYELHNRALRLGVNDVCFIFHKKIISLLHHFGIGRKGSRLIQHHGY